jgi:ribokinase
MRRIIVVGSLNIDLVLPAQRIPKLGETLSCDDVLPFPGGKGANQAYAAARLGGQVAMVGQVGSDAYGPVLLNSLQSVGVDVSNVAVSQGSTGTAIIMVLPDGENSILLSPGANGRFRFKAMPITRGDCLLTQLEVPFGATVDALIAARERGAITVLDPAPARALDTRVLSLVDWLTPNQTEAAVLLEDDELVIDNYESAALAAHRLLGMGARGVIMKLGALGCVVATPERMTSVGSFQVEAVDSTAAGDVFNAAFAVALLEGQDPVLAARFGCAAAAISVTRYGAQPSAPSRVETEALLASGSEESCS